MSIATATSNLVYVGFDEGVKISLFVQGALYKGSFGNAGLIADRFLRVPNSDLSVAEQRQFLSMNGLHAWFEAHYQQLSPAEQTPYAPLMQVHSRQRLALIFSEAYRHLPLCESLINAFYAVLSATIANIIYILQPDQLVLGGMLGMLPDDIFSELDAHIRAHLRPLFANHIHIDQAQLRTENIAALGATYRFVEAIILQNGYLS